MRLIDIIHEALMGCCRSDDDFRLRMAQKSRQDVAIAGSSPVRPDQLFHCHSGLPFRLGAGRAATGEVAGQMLGELASIGFGTVDKCGFAAP